MRVRFGFMYYSGSVRLTPTPSDNRFQDWWRRASMRTAKEARRGLNSMVILIVWEIWKQRNRCTFDVEQPRAQVTIRLIMEEARTWGATGVKKLKQLLP